MQNYLDSTDLWEDGSSPAIKDSCNVYPAGGCYGNPRDRFKKSGLAFRPWNYKFPLGYLNNREEQSSAV